MLNFKKWLYSEAFELPFDNIRKIYEYYAESYKQYLKAPRTKIPPRIIPLDLSGGKYDFLQYLSPHVEVHVKGSLENAAGIYHGIIGGAKIDRKAYDPVTVGKISLSFYNHQHVSYSTIEHEVLHFIQDLIKIHADNKEYAKYKKMIDAAPEAIKSKLKKQNPSEFQSSIDRKKSTYGGLPPMPLVKKLMKDRQIDVKGNKKERRTKHEYRPIEFYTNLNSLIRSLQYYYITLADNLSKAWINDPKLKSLSSGDPNSFETWIKDGFKTKLKSGEVVGSANQDEETKSKIISDWSKDKENKKLFLKKLIDKKDYVVSDLEKVKTLDPELYKIYIREIYKKFIDNNEFASNASEVKKIIDSMQQSKREKEIAKETKQQKKSEKKEKLKEKVLSDKWTEADFTGRITIESYYFDNFSNIYDSENIGYTNSEIAEEMFKEIGLKANNNYEIKFGISAKNLKKIFNNIKKAKDTFGNTDIGKELDQDQINSNFDYMAKELAELISRSLSFSSFKSPSPQEILEIFY